MTCCPVPDCTGAPPPRCVFCPDCYFHLEPADGRMIHRVKFECERALDPEEKSHLTDQLHGYISAGILQILASKRKAVAHAA